MAQSRPDNAPTLYWHDYETSGPDPRRHRPVQFAGVRTDEALNVIGDPLVMYCKPADDVLPDPEAALITGITPQKAAQLGVTEIEFVRAIHAELSQPGTCGVGYNSIRFDDEVTRFALYRNFFDPYGREWQNGNSRWDIIDMVRLTYALRPDGINWPSYEDGRPSFKLEQLTQANGIAHQDAHDALSDVHATIALARLIRDRQPKLFDFVYQHRRKKQIASLIDLREMRPVLHVSSMYPNEYGCIALVVPLAQHPVNTNGIIVYDLRHDPGPLISLNVQQIRDRLFTATSDLPEGVDRIPLKVLHLNKSPVVVPLGTMDDKAAKRTRIDLSAGLRHLQMLRQAKDLTAKLQAVYQESALEPATDPELSLYGGGFFTDRDRAAIARIQQATTDQLADQGWHFDDARLPELLFRFRARNFLQTLSAEERQRWNTLRRERMNGSGNDGFLTFANFDASLQRIRAERELTPLQSAILDKLVEYGARLRQELGMTLAG